MTQFKTMYSTEDLTIAPDISIVDTRKDVLATPFLINAPMDSVYSLGLAKELYRLNQLVCVPRFFKKDEPDPRLELLRYLTEDPTRLNLLTRTFFCMAIDIDVDFLTSAKEILKHKNIQLSINIAIDTAIGASLRIKKTYESLHADPFINHIMSGSIATPNQARFVIAAGCDYLRVGIGGGSACKTRVETGIGIPTWASVDLIYKTCGRANIKIIADGGISNSGQIVKYMIAGADYVMSGRLLAETKESPGWIKIVDIDPDIPFDPNQAAYQLDHIKFLKRYRGQASTEFTNDMLGKDFTYGEGVGFDIEFNGLSTQELVHNLEYGLRSAASYLGINCFTEFRTCYDSIRVITHSGYIEGLPNVHQQSR